MACGYILAGGCDGGGGTEGCGDRRLLPPEQIFTVHYDQAHYGPVYGGGAETGTMGIQSVLGTGRVGFGGDADGGLGGGTEGGVRG